MTDEVPNVRPRARIRIPAPPVAPAPEPEPVEEEEAEPEQSIDERQPAIAGIISQVSARMGANVMRRATAVPGFNQTETGIFSLDVALLGGIPEGLVTMLYGWEASGKTTLAKRIAGRTLQKYPDKACIFVDLEQTYDRQWGAKHGIDNERLIIVSPESGEHAVDIIDAVLRAPETGLVIIDSLPAIIPMAEGTASAEDSQVAMRARLIGRLCSKIHHATIASRNAGNAPTTLMINQWRTKIGVMRGDPRVLPGGNQPKFLCTTMIEVKNKEILERNARGLEIVHHNEHSFNIKKSRIGNSARNGEYTMIRDPNHPLGEGAIDEAGVVVAYGKRFGLITGGGSTRRIEGLDTMTFRTDANIAEFFEQEPEECLDMKRRIIMVLRQEMGLLALPPDGYLLGPVGA